jgi:23S rRNA (uracil1939-C5)-methyltransferase
MGKNKKRKVPVDLDQELELSFTGFTNSGEGVGRVEGFAVFVPYTIPGDRGRVRIKEVKKNFARGELVDLLEEGPGRIEPVCPVYGYCGGCQLQHVDYKRQLELKTQLVKDAITRIGGFPADLVREIKGAAKIWNYRNRGQFPLAHNGSNQIGFFKAGSHQLVPIENCFLQHEKINQLLEVARSYLSRLKGNNLKHLVFKVSPETEKTMAVFVTQNENFPEGEEFALFLREQVPDLASIVQNINPKPYGPVLGRKSRVIWGEESLEDKMNDLEFSVSAESFTQVNPEQTKILYKEALEAAGLTGKETVIDAYCGIGTITLLLARQAKMVYGIEFIPEAIEDARENAEKNRIGNVDFVVGKVEEVLPRMAAKEIRTEVIVVDPPRKGCEPEVLQAMAEMGPERIVYVSCNPATLARDLKLLAGQGYEPKYVQPVDMFPQTHHVECVTLMSKVEK